MSELRLRTICDLSSSVMHLEEHLLMFWLVVPFGAGKNWSLHRMLMWRALKSKIRGVCVMSLPVMGFLCQGEDGALPKLAGIWSLKLGTQIEGMKSDVYISFCQVTLVGETIRNRISRTPTIMLFGTFERICGLPTCHGWRLAACSMACVWQSSTFHYICRAL